MLQRTLRFVSLAAALLLALSVLPGCARFTMTAEEARMVAEPLIEAAPALNEIYFGSGLPVETEPTRLSAFFEALHVEADKAAYLPVNRTCVYQDAASLAAATRAVYSTAYAAYLLDLGFKGVSNGTDEEISLGMADVIYARFKLTEDVFSKGDSILCVRTNLLEEDVRLAEAVFRYDTLEVLKTGVQDGMNWARIRLTADVTDETGEIRASIPVTLRIVQETAGWRLDSPTYISRDVYETAES